MRLDRLYESERMAEEKDLAKTTEDQMKLNNLLGFAPTKGEIEGKIVIAKYSSRILNTFI